MFEKLLHSSANPEKVSLTVKGLLTTLIPVAMVFIKVAGAEISNDDVQKLVDSIAEVIMIATSLLSTVMVVWGLLRKFYYAISKKS